MTDAIIMLQSWLRNWIMVALLYYALGGAWVYYTYFTFGDQLFKPGEIPTVGAVLEQMKVCNDCLRYLRHD